jgi:hypothetical protein
MEFRKFKHQIYDIQVQKWVTLKAYYVHFNTGEVSNIISVQLPVPDYEKVWTIIPTVTYHHDLSIIPGPSFTMKLKWLKWDILTLKWSRSWKDTDEGYQGEEETADHQICQVQ